MLYGCEVLVVPPRRRRRGGELAEAERPTSVRMSVRMVTRFVYVRGWRLAPGASALARCSVSRLLWWCAAGSCKGAWSHAAVLPRRPLAPVAEILRARLT